MTDENDTVLGSTVVPDTTYFNLETTVALAPGPHTLTIAQAGGATWTFPVTTAAEAVEPTIQVDSDVSDPSAGDVIQLSGTGTPDGTVELWNYNTSLGDVSVDGDGNWSTSATLEAGYNQFYVIDNVSNLQSDSIVIRAPGPPVVDTPTDGDTVAPRFLVSGDADPSADVVVTTRTAPSWAPRRPTRAAAGR